jgi:hypothetical protein
MPAADVRIIAMLVLNATLARHWRHIPGSAR